MKFLHTVTVNTTGLNVEETGGAIANAIRDTDASVKEEIVDVTITPFTTRSDISEDWRPNYVTEQGFLLLFKLERL